MCQSRWFAVSFSCPFQVSLNIACLAGNFLAYNPALYIDDPKIDGVVAGTYYDGSPVYAGRGDNSANGGLKPCGGRISVGPSSPGAYMDATNKENYDGTTSEYLYNHRDLVWMNFSKSSNLFRNAYAVKFMSGVKPMLIGRKTFSNYTQVGYVSLTDS